MSTGKSRNYRSRFGHGVPALDYGGTLTPVHEISRGRREGLRKKIKTSTITRALFGLGNGFAELCDLIASVSLSIGRFHVIFILIFSLLLLLLLLFLLMLLAN